MSDTTLDLDAVSQTIKSCISIPILSLAVDTTTLYIRLPAREFTDLEELVNIATLASFFGLQEIVLRRRDVIFTIQVKDVEGVIDGSLDAGDFIDRIETSGLRS